MLAHIERDAINQAQLRAFAEHFSLPINDKDGLQRVAEQESGEYLHAWHRGYVPVAPGSPVHRWSDARAAEALRARRESKASARAAEAAKRKAEKEAERGAAKPVSYTHLTLPTIYSV